MKKILFSALVLFIYSNKLWAQCPGDITPPTVTCPPDINLPANGMSCTGTLNNNLLGSPVVWDSCGIASVTNNHPSASYNAGQNIVVWTVTDLNGNTTTCNQIITIVDNNLPNINGCPASQTVVLNASCSAVLADYTTVVTANDMCTGVTLTQSPAAGTIYNGPDTVTVTVTATDDGGNFTNCVFDVMFIDNTLPVVNCPATTQTINLGSSCQAQIADYTTVVTFSDNCSGVWANQSPLAGTLITGAGPVTVTVTATDVSGNAASCPVNVLLVDNINPTIICPPNITANSNGGGCNGIINNPALGTPVTSDNCGVASVTNDHPSASYPVGTTTVVWTVTDVNGNTATCNQTVTIIDTTPPTINCPGTQTLTLSGSCDATLGNYTSLATTNDNCSFVSVLQSPVPGTIINGAGTTVVTLTASDVAGNTSQCTFNVVVVDNTLPVISCNGNITTCNPVVTFNIPTATDNCAVTVTQTDGTGLSSGSTFPVGTTTMEFTATDASGNTAICTFDIIIEAPPTPAFAGPDQLLCGVTTATLAANTPAVGTGIWTIVSGLGTFGNDLVPGTGITGLAPGQNLLVWTVSNGSCPSSSDTVMIECGVIIPATANSTPVICGTNANLTGNNPSPGFGSWSVLSGNGIFVNASNPSTIVTGLNIGVNQFVWSITSGSCAITADTVTINAEEPPTMAVLPVNFSVCDSLDSVNVVGNLPLVGTGVWSLVSGPGTISNPLNDTTMLAGFSSATMVSWTITNTAACPPSVAVMQMVPVNCTQYVVTIPTAFTPNNDGANDVWDIPNLALAYPNNKVEIFTRWGGKIFESDGYQVPWDGTFRGEIMPLGVYYFIIRFNGSDGREPESGTLTIIK